MENKQGKSSLRQFLKDLNTSISEYSENVTYNQKFKIYSPSSDKSRYIVVESSKLQNHIKDITNRLTNKICEELEDLQKGTLKQGCIPELGKDIFIFKEDYTIWKMNWGLEVSKSKCPKCGEKITREKRWKCDKCGATYKT